MQSVQAPRARADARYPPVRDCQPPGQEGRYDRRDRLAARRARLGDRFIDPAVFQPFIGPSLSLRAHEHITRRFPDWEEFLDCARTPASSSCESSRSWTRRRHTARPQATDRGFLFRRAYKGGPGGAERSARPPRSRSGGAGPSLALTPDWSCFPPRAAGRPVGRLCSRSNRSGAHEPARVLRWSRPSRLTLAP
jgi:hypothetical protein